MPVALKSGSRAAANPSGKAERQSSPRLSARAASHSVTAATTAARLCVSPLQEHVLVGGVAGIQGDQRAPTLNGQRIGARVAIWYWPEPGARKTLLGMLPDIAHRAALFRPGWVGAWTYWALLFALTPLLIYAALRLVALAAAGLRGRLPAWLAIGLIGAANAAAFATMTPPFQVPDEPDHVAYAQVLGETGHTPTGSPRTCA